MVPWGMNKALLLLALSALGSAQEPKWAASFADQGKQVSKAVFGRAPDDITVYQGNVCAGAEIITLDAGSILRELHVRGLVIFDGRTLDAFTVRTKARDWTAILAGVGEYTALGSAVLVNAETVKMTPEDRNRVTFAAAAVAGVSRLLGSRLSKRTIDPAELRSFHIPPSTTLRPFECWRGAVIGLRDPNQRAVTFRVE